MKSSTLYIVNNVPNKTGDIFREQVLARLPAHITTEYLLSKEMAITTHGVEGTVGILSKGSLINVANSLFLFQGRGLEKNFPMTSLLANILEILGVPYTDQLNIYSSQFSSKSFLIPRLAAYGLPVPRTLILSYTSFPAHVDYIADTFQFPLILKVNGAQGLAVRLVPTKDELESTLEDLRSTSDKKAVSLITVQAYVQNSYDVRALFYKDTYIASQRRQAPEGSFLNNISRGGSAAPDTLSAEEIVLCQQVVSHSKIDFAGVDFIRTPDGPVFLEVNQVPQLEGISGVYPDLDFGTVIVEDILRRLA